MISKLDDAHIDIILQTHLVGRLACCSDGQPYVVPLTYVFHEGCIYGHTNAGEKLRILRQNPQVCFEVDDIVDFSCWSSVLARGVFEELHGEEAAKALDLIVSRLAAHVTSESALPMADSTMTKVQHSIRMRPTKGVIYRIRITAKSGRYERHEGRSAPLTMR